MTRPGTSRQRVQRADGRTINVARRRGHLSYCFHGCCCGRTDKGYVAAPVDTYKDEWTRRKIRNQVHLTKAGCLGPCALSNVAHLVFDGHDVWFHSVNDAWLVVAIFDYISAMLEADGFLPPPPELLEYTFNYYTWDAASALPMAGRTDPAVAVSQPPDALSGVAFLTHADTDLLNLRAAQETLPADFGPVTGVPLGGVRSEAQMATLLSGEVGRAQVVLVRIHGKFSAVPGAELLLAHARKAGQALLLVSGTGEPDAELAALSLAPAHTLDTARTYLAASGWQNTRELLLSLSDTLRLTAYGAAPPLALPEHGVYHPELPENATLADWHQRRDPARPAVGVLFYRAHALSGNTGFIDALVGAFEEAGADALPVFTTSLKDVDAHGDPKAFGLLRGEVDAVISTLSFAMADVQAGEITAAGENVGALARLNVPVVQGLTSGGARGPWETSSRGLSPLDTAMNVALPEFDGRIIGVPFAFKEQDGAARRLAADPERTARLAGITVRLAALRHKPNVDKRIAFVFTNSTAKASQVGNAVGLDSAASLLLVLRALKGDGYTVGDLPATSDELMHRLIERTSYDTTLLTPSQLAQAAARVPAATYEQWFAELPDTMQRRMRQQWGAPPGEAYVHDGSLALAGLHFGNVFVALQPPRGYGMDPDAIYHTPDLPPTHHYFALYRWLREPAASGGFGADAMVHVGKHGTLEWLPGKGVGLSEKCFPDAVLGDLPLFYPFVINDPGEGTQAKRRAHATILDHLPPPLTRADTYGPLAELAALVDEYYQLELLDPSKLPLLQGQIWDLVQQADLGTDLGSMLRRDHGDHVHEWDEDYTEEGVPVTLSEMNGADVAHLLEDIDGYLCELGAAQIRGGLHTLGLPPQGEALAEMLRALTRLSNAEVPGLNAGLCEVLGLDLNRLLDTPGERFDAPAVLDSLAGRPVQTHGDALEVLDELALHLYQALADHNFDPQATGDVLAHTLGERDDYGPLPLTLKYVCEALKPNLDATTAEITYLLAGLSGRYVPAGPSGAPSRGQAHILPTGRNFYAVDPRALPSQAAWTVGSQLAREVLSRHQRETGAYPEHVAISVWGTSNMRTQGDDIAEIFALLGVRPVWHPQSRRLDGVELIPLSELGRPRIDVTVRISGFFRDAFPHLISRLDEAFALAMHADEDPEQNYPRKHFLADLEGRLQDLPPEEAEARAAYRVFGSAPGTYGAGILDLIHEGNWQGEEDFAQVFVNWGGYAYTAAEQGTDAREDFRARLSQTQLVLHNQDNREHDIFDSDDYLQFFGGMIASVRHLSGAQPRGYFGDSANPERARVRDLKEESLRVYRSRVVNPKWLDGIRQHGYKGGLEQTATVDYLFGFDATAGIAHDFMYEGIAQAYALDPVNQAFLRDSNPWALNAIATRLLEAEGRGLWSPEPTTLAALQGLLVESEGLLEDRGETARVSG
ncbi:cobaltochelatase subunit CobN [Deinococcus deserti]|uniref:Putative cobaltochelatase, CobN subunit (Hydrogenobyrinic acid a,c-diamide cobaltochelatase) n=1 Tax=Deinococcus deserti (strain DSM 17065 / CIP 109153 / LMG 22923 / VCD115) TaxID=546414 RepID=C1D349_DEIDV|nr:cobaltochelatase subunit CobN [Deinococcus deserti]ACO47838.1 putative cobaltochelatase, CobN subunit (Hydrogenobyrinic acid a,c-diamide cobaltochelatase) [Deinococcus deserti VCD115]